MASGERISTMYAPWISCAEANSLLYVRLRPASFVYCVSWTRLVSYGLISGFMGSKFEVFDIHMWTIALKYEKRNHNAIEFILQNSILSYPHGLELPDQFGFRLLCSPSFQSLK